MRTAESPRRDAQRRCAPIISKLPGVAPELELTSLPEPGCLTAAEPDLTAPNAQVNLASEPLRVNSARGLGFTVKLGELFFSARLGGNYLLRRARLANSPGKALHPPSSAPAARPTAHRPDFETGFASKTCCVAALRQLLSRALGQSRKWKWTQPDVQAAQARA